MGDLKSACWHSDGLQFVTGHADGSTCIWSVNNVTEPTQVKKLYGELLDEREGEGRREGRERDGGREQEEGRREGRERRNEREGAVRR